MSELTIFEWPYKSLSVCVAGSFNNWENKITMIKTESGIWTTFISLLPGLYEYKFIIDGQHWYYDVTKPTINDNQGAHNNFIIIEPRPNYKIYKPICLHMDKFVYKSCGDWIVIMEKLVNTITNDARVVKNKSYAKFRANMLYVVAIVNKIDHSKTIDSVTNVSYRYKAITYKPGEIINVSDYNPNINTICSTGIHYFHTYKAAFFYDYSVTNGKIMKWYDDGDVWCKEFFSNGKKNGISVYFWEDRIRYTESNYVNDELTGPYTEWYRNNYKCQQGNYLNDKKTGKWVGWYYDGQICCERYYLDGELNGQYNEWHKNNNKCCEGNYLNGMKTGKWIAWHDAGQISSERYYLEGQTIGLWLEWYENGQKYSETNHLDDGKIVTRSEWHDNSQPKTTGSFCSGERIGLHTWWYDNGNRHYEMNFLNDQQTGLYTEWYDNGQKKIEGSYAQGEVVGIWTEWFDDGKIKSTKNTYET
jgi:antitoxin component YwqK of YwqJK toxin-antitoxin module